MNLETTDEQSRLNTLIRALKRLPDDELALYGLSRAQLEENVTPGSRESTIFFDAWQERQKELKKAIESMLKPADYMKELVEFIVDTSEVPPGSTKFSSKMDALLQLESLVEDIDNARDFYTTGCFTSLSASVFGDTDNNYTMEERGIIALTLGNAVKSDYDFQLWVLENEAICLHGLLEMLESSDSDDILRRRALYALSSAARGNPDVQSLLLSMESPSKTKGESELAENAMNNNRFAMILHDLTEVIHCEWCGGSCGDERLSALDRADQEDICICIRYAC